MTDCPCCSGLPFKNCCEPFLTGAAKPETAEQTMRARYTAHTRVEMAYLMATLHPSNIEEGAEESSRRWAEDSQWLGLDIVSTSGGAAGDSEGLVEFIARYRDGKGDIHAHHEKSLFVKENGGWLFKEGQSPEPTQARRDATKVGRNDPCSCGSGKKYKKCCEGKAASA